MMKPITIFLLITLTTLVSAIEPDHSTYTTESETQKLKSRDAITLSIQEIRETTKFIKSIPWLKSLQLTHQTPKLLLCVDRLISDLNTMKSTLHRLKHLKHTNLLSDANSLKREMAHSVMFSKTCSKSLRNVDEIVPLLLTRKLDDLSMVTDAVVHQVSKMERNVHREDTKANP